MLRIHSERYQTFDRYPNLGSQVFQDAKRKSFHNTSASQTRVWTLLQFAIDFEFLIYLHSVENASNPRIQVQPHQAAISSHK